jgi:hypothetical protein
MRRLGRITAAALILLWNYAAIGQGSVPPGNNTNPNAGGGSGTVTSIATGCQATGGTITTSGTISTQLVESANSPSSSGGYTVAASDLCTNLVLKSGYSGTLTIPATSTSGFGSGAYGTVTNESGLNVAVAITTDTLGGFSAFNIGPGGTFSFQSDGTNYHWTGATGAVSFQTGSSTGNTFTPYAGYFICTSTCTVTPPVPAPGYQFCVMNDDNVSTVITLGALGSSARYEGPARTAYGTAGTGTLSSGGAAADMACIVGRDATHYLTPTYVGTWTAS